MSKIYLGGLYNKELTDSIGGILAEKGYECLLSTSKGKVSFDDIEAFIDASEICVMDDSSEADDFSSSLERKMILKKGKTLVLLLTGNIKALKSGRELEEMAEKDNVHAFDLTDGKNANDAAEYIIGLIGTGKATANEGKKETKDPRFFPEKNTPREPYTGNEDYLFVSFAEEDRYAAYYIIRNMQDNGYRVWYDSQIKSAQSADKIAEKIEQSCFVIAFISPHYMESEDCKDEINLARDLNKERLLVYLEKTRLSPGMAMRMLRLQNIHKYTYKTHQEFFNKLYSTKGIERANQNGGTESGTGRKEQQKRERIFVGGGDKPCSSKDLFTPYKGEEDYIYISYSHADSEWVFDIVERLHNRGFRMWHDDGIPSGAQFTKHLACRLMNCKVFLCFLSRNYVASDFMLGELHYAMGKERTVIPIFLQDFELPDEVEFELLTTKWAFLLKFRSFDEFVDNLIENNEVLDSCRG